MCVPVGFLKWAILFTFAYNLNEGILPYLLTI